MEMFIHDVSIQYYVLNALGIQVSKSFVVLLDSTYTRKNALDVKALFEPIDVSQRVLDLQNSIPEKIQALKQVISESKVEPDIDIGTHCHINGKKCPAKKYCWQVQRDIPDYSVFEIFEAYSFFKFDYDKFPTARHHFKLIRNKKGSARIFYNFISGKVGFLKNVRSS